MLSEIYFHSMKYICRNVIMISPCLHQKKPREDKNVQQFKIKFTFIKMFNKNMAYRLL